MNTKMVKVLMTVLMVIFCLCTVSQAVLAAEGDPWDIKAEQPDDISDVKEVAGKVLGLIQAASGIAAVVLIAIFGFKFIMGSANEKADYQKSFIPLIVGVVVVFAATSIANLLFTTFTNSEG